MPASNLVKITLLPQSYPRGLHTYIHPPPPSSFFIIIITASHTKRAIKSPPSIVQLRLFGGFGRSLPGAVVILITIITILKRSLLTALSTLGRSSTLLPLRLLWC